MQKYEILGVIGEGAYGVVHKCRLNESKQIVAIKKFKQTQDDEIVRKTTMRQVKILKMLKHPNTVELKQAFRKKGIVYLVFQFVQNNLLEILEKQPDGLQPQMIRILTYQMLKGLAYLHAQDIIHRDIKPQNLLVGDHMQLKICDFGFARQIRKSDDDLTDYVATRWYRPPQLLVGAKYGKPIDLWAVGCIVGELIDGNPIFPGQNELDQLFLIQKCLGPLTPDYYDIFLKNPRFLGMKFPEIHALDTIEKRYVGKASSKTINFLKQLLKINPNDRLTAIDAIKHPYFDGIRQQDFVRKLSSNNYMKNQSKILQNIRQQQPKSSANQNRKKYQTNQYTSTNNHQRQHTQQTAYTDHMNNNKNKISFNQKKNKQQRPTKINMASTLSKGFIAPTLHSKSMNKSKGNPKINEKHISLEKHQHRQVITKTQTGFYITGGGIIPQGNEDDQEFQYNRNKIYNIKSPKSKQNNRKQNIVSPQEVAQECQDNEWQPSNSILPSLIMNTNKYYDHKKQLQANQV